MADEYLGHSRNDDITLRLDTVSNASGILCKLNPDGLDLVTNALSKDLSDGGVDDDLEVRPSEYIFREVCGLG